MNKAVTMFSELGFKIYSSDEDFLLYKYEKDYDQMTIYFDLQQKIYNVHQSRFINREDEFGAVPISERPQNMKYSCLYGHWQMNIGCKIGLELHNAIHQQMIELGWIE